MKRTVILSAAALLLATVLNAQEAFKHLSMGIEAGTAGAGVELALPVVSNHVVFKLGYNMLPGIPVNYSASFPTSSLNTAINSANTSITTVNTQLAPFGKSVPSISGAFPASAQVDAQAKIGFGSAKAMLEYYPFAKSGFHIVAGLYLGGGDGFVCADVYSDKAFWSSYKSVTGDLSSIRSKLVEIKPDLTDQFKNEADNAIARIDEVLSNSSKVSVGERTYEITEEDGRGYADINVNIPSARPFFGLGFGRSIPETHFGFQVDLGAWYHGSPELYSSNERTYDPEAMKVNADLSLLDKLSFWPQLSFRLVYRIF